jgi:DNA-binding FrmR family transcriptional regulator
MSDTHEHAHEHIHTREDGSTFTHRHDSAGHSDKPEHNHTHSHTQTKAVLNRLSRAIGHLESVKRMVESGRDCSEVLMQMAAVRSALNNTAKIILKDHIQHCLVDAVEENDLDALEELNNAIEQYLK